MPAGSSLLSTRLLDSTDPHAFKFDRFRPKSTTWELSLHLTSSPLTSSSFPLPLKPPKVRKIPARLWGSCDAHQADTHSAVLVGRGKHVPFSSDDAAVKTAFERQTGVEASDLFKVEEA